MDQSGGVFGQSRHSPNLPLQEDFVPPVGRADEQTAIREELAAAIEGNGRVIIIGGEAGIGKTTLVRLLASEALQRNVRVLQGNCYDVFSTPAFGPWLELFASLESPEPLSAFSGEGTKRVSDQGALFASVRAYLGELSRSSCSTDPGRPALVRSG